MKVADFFPQEHSRLAGEGLQEAYLGAIS